MFYQEDNFVNGFIELMKKCNSKILDIYNDDFFHVTYKEDESPLTMADKVCNDIICNHLNGLNFHRDLNIGIVSEENKNEHFMVRKNYKYVWLILTNNSFTMLLIFFLESFKIFKRLITCLKIINKNIKWSILMVKR